LTNITNYSHISGTNLTESISFKPQSLLAQSLRMCKIHNTMWRTCAEVMLAFGSMTQGG